MLRVLIVVFFLTALFTNSLLSGNQHFSLLAQSFLTGKTYFTQAPDNTWTDTVPFNGRHYWPLGPFPAIALIPFNLLELVDQRYLNYLLLIGVFYLVYRIALKTDFAKNEALFWAFSFCFASVFMSVIFIPASWYFAQVITVFLIFFALWEYLNKRRYIVIGIIFGCIFATRMSAGLGIVLFVLDILFSKSKNKKILLFKLMFPILISLSLLGIYNYYRFGNMFESGYKIQILFNESLYKARSIGLLNLSHIPDNLYRFLFAGPLPVTSSSPQILKFPFIRADSWGMNIFVTSPMFIYLFFLRYKDKLSKLLWANVAVVAIPIFMYYGIGYTQLGYRYSLDFLPYLLLLLMINYHKQLGPLSLRFKALILLSAVFNLFLFYTWINFRYA